MADSRPADEIDLGAVPAVVEEALVGVGAVMVDAKVVGKAEIALMSLAEAIDLACAGIRVFGDRLALVARQATGSLLSGLRLFVDAYLDIAARAYRRTHRRLPGSERTARLRKKRRVVLLRWFLLYVQGKR